MPGATRLKQVGVTLLGLAVAAIMIGLGIWQLNVYSSQGTRVAQARAAETPVDLMTVAPPGQPIGDAYGRTVTAGGHYDPRLQLLIPVDGAPGRYRVLTALLLPGGGAVPIVRGVTDSASVASIPAPPTGQVEQGGVFLPSEPDAQRNPSLGSRLNSVQLPVLAQRWSPALSNGFITLQPAEASAQRLSPATVALPGGQGRAQNAAYALQWWIFSAFALAMALRMARDIGRRADYEYAQELADIPTGQDGTISDDSDVRDHGDGETPAISELVDRH